MNFSFAINDSFIIFIVIFVLFFFWQLMKMVKPSYWDSADEVQKKKVAEIITLTNIVVGVITAIIIMALGIGTNFWELLVKVGAVASAGSIFDLAKAYGLVKV